MKNILIMCTGMRVCSCIQLFATLWTVAGQAPLSMGFPRQEYWTGLPFPPLGDLPDPGIKPESPVSPVLTHRFLTTEPPKLLKLSASDNLWSCLLQKTIEISNFQCVGDTQ